MLPLELSNYFRPITVCWDPWRGFAKDLRDIMPSCPDCRTKGVEKLLEFKDWTEKKILRFDMLPAVCLTRRFICNGCEGCKEGKKSTTHVGWDHAILAQLPTHIQRMFTSKYNYQHRALVEIELIDQLKFLSVHSVPVASFAEMLKERAVAAFQRRELDYKTRVCANGGGAASGGCWGD